jgi:hypothetical protein
MYEFEYLHDLGMEYGDFYLEDQFKDFVVNATNDQLSEVAIAYKIIESRDDAFRLSRWVDRCYDPHLTIDWQERAFARRVGQLLILFHYLADARIPPFSSRNVEYVEAIKKPNWQSLPVQVRYLIDVAESHGIYSSEAEIVDFLAKADQRDIDLLAETAQKLQANGHMQILNDWQRRHPFDEYQEARMVEWLLCLIDHAGFSIKRTGEEKGEEKEGEEGKRHQEPL